MSINVLELLCTDNANLFLCLCLTIYSFQRNLEICMSFHQQQRYQSFLQHQPRQEEQQRQFSDLFSACFFEKALWASLGIGQGAPSVTLVLGRGEGGFVYEEGLEFRSG